MVTAAPPRRPLRRAPAQRMPTPARLASPAAALQVLRRDRIVGPLGVPEDRDDPPAGAIVQELNAVDAARERLRIRLRGLRVIRAEYVRDVAEPLRSAPDLAFEETTLLQHRPARSRVLLRREQEVP